MNYKSNSNIKNNLKYICINVLEAMNARYTAYHVKEFLGKLPIKDNLLSAAQLLENYGLRTLPVNISIQQLINVDFKVILFLRNVNESYFAYLIKADETSISYFVPHLGFIETKVDDLAEFWDGTCLLVHNEIKPKNERGYFVNKVLEIMGEAEKYSLFILILLFAASDLFIAKNVTGFVNLIFIGPFLFFNFLGISLILYSFKNKTPNSNFDFFALKPVLLIPFLFAYFFGSILSLIVASFDVAISIFILLLLLFFTNIVSSKLFVRQQKLNFMSLLLSVMLIFELMILKHNIEPITLLKWRNVCNHLIAIGLMALIFEIVHRMVVNNCDLRNKEIQEIDQNNLLVKSYWLGGRKIRISQQDDFFLNIKNERLPLNPVSDYPLNILLILSPYDKKSGKLYVDWVDLIGFPELVLNVCFIGNEYDALDVQFISFLSSNSKLFENVFICNNIRRWYTIRQKKFDDFRSRFTQGTNHLDFEHVVDWNSWARINNLKPGSVLINGHVVPHYNNISDILPYLR